jgi:hypothetical protein
MNKTVPTPTLGDFLYSVMDKVEESEEDKARKEELKIARREDLKRTNPEISPLKYGPVPTLIIVAFLFLFSLPFDFETFLTFLLISLPFLLISWYLNAKLWNDYLTGKITKEELIKIEDETRRRMDEYNKDTGNPLNPSSPFFLEEHRR